MKFTLLVTFFLAITISCKKEREFVVVLPPESTTGQNTLGFLYTGTTVWSSIERGIFLFSDKPDNIPNARAILFHEANGDKYLQFGGEMKIQNNSSVITSNSGINFWITNNNLTTGNFYFDTTNGSNFIEYYDNMISKHYYNYTNNSFLVSINKMDTTQKIVSGSFSGTLYRKIGTTFFMTDSIKIHQGRFDIKYVDYP